MRKAFIVAPGLLARGFLAAVAGAAGFWLASQPIVSAFAQDRADGQAPKTNFRWGKVGEPVKLEIDTARQQNIRYVRILGVPGDFRLSRGFSVRDGSIWYVSTTDVPMLALIPPKDFAGVARLSVDFIMPDKGADNSPASKSELYVLKIGDDTGAIPPAARSTPEQPAQHPAARPTAASQEKVSQPYQEENAAFSRAQDFLKRGDVTSARLLFEDLALSGSAQGALALARTFDPDFLRSAGVIGMQPDVEQARKWYKKASELGNGEASRRLSDLR